MKKKNVLRHNKKNVWCIYDFLVEKKSFDFSLATNDLEELAAVFFQKLRSKTRDTSTGSRDWSAFSWTTAQCAQTTNVKKLTQK